MDKFCPPNSSDDLFFCIHHSSMPPRGSSPWSGRAATVTPPSTAPWITLRFTASRLSRAEARFRLCGVCVVSLLFVSLRFVSFCFGFASFCFSLLRFVLFYFDFFRFVSFCSFWLVLLRFALICFVLLLFLYMPYFCLLYLL